MAEKAMNSFSSGEQYFEAVFRSLELPEEHYQDIEFEDCQFSNCDFSGVRFQRCKFVNCKFVRCNLSLIDLSNSKLSEVTFQESKMVGVDWTKANWPHYHADFELEFQRCILNSSAFFGLSLTETVFDECQLRDVDFRGGNFSKSTMTSCEFTNSLFMQTNLEQVDFSESSGYAINVLENSVKGARFSRYEALSLLEFLGIELVD